MLLLPSQVRSIESLLAWSGLPPEDFAWRSRNGEWAGYISGETPEIVFMHPGDVRYYFTLSEDPKDVDVTGYTYGPSGPKGWHRVLYSPGAESIYNEASSLDWQGVLEHVSRWLSYIRREVGIEDIIPTSSTDDHAGPNTMPAVEAVSTAENRSNRPPESNRVFIVHGHDEVNTLKLRELLRERFGLSPVVLNASPGRGRPTIQKFEDEAENCAFAFVLLTPDDQVETERGEYTQARPNVIFELGWFYGKLGRDRVTLLLKSGTKIHSDLEGVSRIEFSANVEERVLEIERELSAAGMLPDGSPQRGSM